MPYNIDLTFTTPLAGCVIGVIGVYADGLCHSAIAENITTSSSSYDIIAGTVSNSATVLAVDNTAEVVGFLVFTYVPIDNTVELQIKSDNLSPASVLAEFSTIEFDVAYIPSSSSISIQVYG